MKRVLHTVILSLAVVSVVGSASARPVVPAENRYWSYSGELPPCDDPSILSKISDRFAQKESEYWNSSLEIVNYDRIKAIGVRPWGLDHIPRTFCMVRAYLNDHTIHEVSYSIGEDTGVIGAWDGVSWCVSGLDRDFAYAPNCKEARP